MPNWTKNTVKFEGSKEKISELKKKFKSKDNVFDFNKIIPMPKNSKKFQAKGGVSHDDMEMVSGDLVVKSGKPNNWYIWSANNWGTKWNSVDAQINNESDTHVEYYLGRHGTLQEEYRNHFFRRKVGFLLDVPM